MNYTRHLFFILAFILFSLSAFSQQAKEKFRLFIIGNSFSVNASKFLPQLAKEGVNPAIADIVIDKPAVVIAEDLKKFRRDNECFDSSFMM